MDTYRKKESDLLRQLCSASPLHSATFGKGHHPIYKIPTPCCRVSFLLPEVDECKSRTTKLIDNCKGRTNTA